MQFERTDLEGVVLIKPPIFKDFRGEYIELYNEALYAKNGITQKFVEDDISMSRKNVLRGLHGDYLTWKLVSCLYGKFFLAVVNCDKESKNFGKWKSFELSDSNRHQVLIPPKYGNGHLVLSDSCVFHYKQSAYYDRTRQFTYRWDDPKFNIPWPVKNPVLSERDEQVKHISKS